MKTFFTLCLCLILSGELLASDYYWVGGSGNWSDFSHHWATTSGGITFHTSAPTTSDDVFFDANSFSTGSIVVVNVDAFSASLDFEGITKPLTLGLANTLTVSGSLSLSNQMTLAGYKNVVLDSPNTGLLVKTAGNTYPASLVFQGGGSWSLVDELKTNTTTAGQGISIIHGILNTNNQKLIVGRFNGNTNNGLYKEVILGNSEIHVSESFISRRIDVLSASASKIYMMGLLTTSTFTAKSGQTFGDVEFLNSSLSFTATPYNAIFNKMTAYGSVIFAGNFRTDSLILAAGKSYSLAKSVTSTVYDHFEITDNKDFPTTLKSNLAGTLATLILPEEICAENLSVQDLNLTGGSLNAAKGSVDLGNNTNVMFYPTATCEELDNPPTGTWYWVGGSGNWSDYSNHWATSSGGTVFADSVPGVNDNVVFDQNSFNDADTVVLDIEASAKNMEWVDVAHSPLFNRQSNGLTLTGSLKFSSEMSISGGGAWKFESDTISTIDFANIPVLGTFTFLGDGEWTLLSDLVTSQNIRLYRGTLNTNGFDMSMNQFDATGFQGFTSLILGSSTLTTGYQFNSYGLTVMDAGTSTIICNGSGLMRNYTYHNIELAPFGGELSGNFTANKVSISDNQYLGNSYNGGASPTIDSLIVNAGSTLHIDPVGVVTVNSFLEASGSTIKSVVSGSPATISMPSGIDNCFENLTLKDMNATGGASFTAAYGSVDQGNNTGIDFYPALHCEELNNPPTGTLYWVGGSGNWSDYANHWATSSGGTVFADSVPGVNDNVVFDQNSFNDADTVVLDIEASAKNMDWVDVAHTPLFNRQSNGLTLTGSLKFSSEMSISGGGHWRFESDTISTMDFANIPVLGTFTFLGDGEWTLLSDLVTSHVIRLYGGTLNTNGFDVSMHQFDATGFQGFTSLVLGSSTLSTALAFNSYGLTVLDAGTSTIVCNGFGLMRSYSYHNIELTSLGGELSGNFIANKVSISDSQYLGNSYNGGASPTIDSLIVNAGSTLHIDPVGVVTVNSFLEASGSTIKSVVSGSPATISMPSGIDNCFENLTIKDINAIGGASFTAAQGYDNQGGNSGWTFSNDPCAGSSSMARMTEATALDTSSSTLIPSVIYPNPFESNFTVINPYQGKGEVEVRIIDQAGKIVFLEKRDAGAEQFDIQVKTIKRGMYMLMLTQGDKMISHKIVKE